MFIIVSWMGVADIFGNGGYELSLTLLTLISLFFVGIISSAAMVIPGISGSLVMLILGWYHSFLFMINGFVDALRFFNMNDLLVFSIYCVFFWNRPTYRYRWD